MNGFDGALLRGYVDFESVMEEASRRYEAVGRLCVDGVRVKNGGFESWARKTRWAGVYYGMKAREIERVDGGGGDVGANILEGGVSDGDVLAENFWESAVDLGDAGFDEVAADVALL